MIFIRKPGSGNSWSSWTIFILFLLIVILRSRIPFANTISWDVFGYYLYLPALFIHHDLALRDLSWVYQLMDQYQNSSTLYQAFQIPEGGVVLKYSCGMAVMYAPFFFAAHLLAPTLGYAADGLSDPYQVAMVMAGLTYTLAGLVLIRKLLLCFFNDHITSYLLLIVVAGTHYLQMVFQVGLLTHNILFTLYAAVILLTYQWHHRPGLSKAALLGFLIGLVTLIRPTDGLIILIPLLWNMSSWKGIKEKLALLVRHWRSVLVFLIFLGIAGAPQLVYWKWVTGKFLYYSYINPGEGFDFRNPHTLDFLFSFRKGWLVYTPVMAVALAGLVAVYRKNRPIFTPLVLFLLVYIYVVSSWSCWYYAGSFGQRPMVQALAVLVLPAGYLIASSHAWRTWKKWMLHGFIAACILLNLFQTWQYSFAYIIDPSRMTAAYYWKVFGKTSINLEDKQLLLVERPAEAVEHFTDTLDYRKTKEWLMDFEKVDSLYKGYQDQSCSFQGNYSLRLDSGMIYSPAFRLKYHELTARDHAWIRVSAMVFIKDSVTENPFSLVTTFAHRGDPYKYRAQDLIDPGQKPIPGIWSPLSLDYMTPEVRNLKDTLSVYGWLRGKTPVWMDQLKVEVFEKR